MSTPFDLKPWFAVATPHEDIRKGRLSEAVFAANIWAVAQGTAPDIYLDPEAFFSKTYLTGGLSRILQRVGRSLAGEADAGDRIFSLQTSFGGGKTHSLVALWHLAKHTDKIRRSAECAEVRKALEDSFPAKVKGVAVFTTQTCDPTQGRKTPEGVHTRTLWGELALPKRGRAVGVAAIHPGIRRSDIGDTHRYGGRTDAGHWDDSRPHNHRSSSRQANRWRSGQASEENLD